MPGEEVARRLANPSALAKRMEEVFGEPFYMSAKEMEAALIALERSGSGAVMHLADADGWVRLPHREGETFDPPRSFAEVEILMTSGTIQRADFEQSDSEEWGFYPPGIIHAASLSDAEPIAAETIVAWREMSVNGDRKDG